MWASITSGLVGISSAKLSRRRGELWSEDERGMGTNTDTADVLVHCKLTQFHMPRGSRARFSGSFGRWLYCERNFDYLNWLSTRNCGAGRPHVWLCHALPVTSFSRLVSEFARSVITKLCRMFDVDPDLWNSVRKLESPQKTLWRPEDIKISATSPSRLYANRAISPKRNKMGLSSNGKKRHCKSRASVCPILHLVNVDLHTAKYKRTGVSTSRSGKTSRWALTCILVQSEGDKRPGCFKSRRFCTI